MTPVDPVSKVKVTRKQWKADWLEPMTAKLYETRSSGLWANVSEGMKQFLLVEMEEALAASPLGPCPPEPAPEWEAGSFRLQVAGGLAQLDGGPARYLNVEDLTDLIEKATAIRDYVDAQRAGEGS